MWAATGFPFLDIDLQRVGLRPTAAVIPWPRSLPHCVYMQSQTIRWMLPNCVGAAAGDGGSAARHGPSASGCAATRWIPISECKGLCLLKRGYASCNSFGPNPKHSFHWCCTEIEEIEEIEEKGRGVRFFCVLWWSAAGVVFGDNHLLQCHNATAYVQVC